MSRTYTAPERALHARLVARGTAVPPASLRRLRDLDLLGDLDTAGRYDTDRAEAIAAAALHARAAGLAWPAIPAAIFGQGVPVPHSPLLASYRYLWAGISADLPATVDPEDAADHLAQSLRGQAKRNPLGRSLIDRSGEYGARRGGRVETTLVVLLSLILHPDVSLSDESKATAAQVAGIDPELADDVLASIAAVNRDNVLAYLEHATLDDLARARDLLARYRKVAQAIADDHVALAENPGLSIEPLIDVRGPAYLVPMVGLIEHNSPEITAQLDLDWMR